MSTPSTGTEIRLKRLQTKEWSKFFRAEVAPSAESETCILLAKMRRLTAFSAVVAASDCVLAYMDMKYSLRTDFDRSLSQALRLCSLLISVLLLACIVSFHVLKTQALHLEGELYAPDPLYAMWSLPRIRFTVLLEVLLNAIIVPPSVNFEVQFDQLGTSNFLTVSEILLPFVAGRMYHTVRWLYYRSPLHQRKARFHL